MKNTVCGIVMLSAAVFATVCCQIAFGGPREQVAVAEACVWAAQNQNPAITPDTYQTAGPTPLTVPQLIDLQEKRLEEIQAQHDSELEQLRTQISDVRVSKTNLATEAEEELSRMAHEIELLRSAIPPKPVNTSPPIAGMKLELTPDPAQAASPNNEISWRDYTPQALQESVESGKPMLVVIGAEWCRECHRLDDTTFEDREVIDLVSSSMVPVYVDYDSEKRIVNAFNVTSLPYVAIVNSESSRPIRRASVGYQSPAQMREFLKDVERAPRVAIQGSGGALRGRRQISYMLKWWRENIGTKPVEFAWRRTGAQTFPLLHQRPEQWTCANIMGTLGEFSIEAPGSKLPIQPIILGYRRSNGMVVLRGEVATSEQSLGFPGDQTIQGAATTDPVGFGPATIVTIASTINALWQILHPNVDLTLGGTVSATCKLADEQDELTIEFKDCPGVKIQAWLQFDLKAKRLVIVPENLHVDVDGSRWIKSRDIRVVE